jgi:5'(3')-deoxyribonucleotidase
LDLSSWLNIVLFVFVREPAATHLKNPTPKHTSQKPHAQTQHHKTTHTTRDRQQWHEQIFPLVGATTTIVGATTTIVGAATMIDGVATPLVGTHLNDKHHHRPKNELKRKKTTRLLKQRLGQNRTMATTTM